jgi:hypothetical protein
MLPITAMSFCEVPQPRLVCAEYFASSLVVEATLERTEIYSTMMSPNLSRRVSTRSKCEKRYAVKLRKTFESMKRIRARSGFDWVQGKEYLLFLFYLKSENAWALDGCGNSQPLAAAADVLSEMEAIKAARGGGAIHGVVGEEFSGGIASAKVEARAGARRYTANTNDKGEFVLNVPPGRYVVRAVKRGMVFKTADFSYEDPQNIQIQPGGCVQVQFARAK